MGAKSGGAFIVGLAIGALAGAAAALCWLRNRAKNCGEISATKVTR